MKYDFSAWPKVELHRHAEGCMRPSTFLALARKANIELPAYSLEQAHMLIELQDDEMCSFSGFIRTFRWLRKVICSRDALTRVIYEAIEDAHKENIRYLELRFNPGAMFMQGLREEDVAGAIHDAIKSGENDFPMHVGIIGIVGRDMEPEIFSRSVDFCIATFQEGIDAIDLAGSETVPPDQFAPYFAKANQAGLPVTIHAGEIAGAENIIKSIRMLGASRIGHGTHLFDMEEAVQCVLDHGIAIETCLTSNLHTGAVQNIADHPLPRMITRGIPVSINTDDPTVSRGLTLNDEYRVATEILGLSKETLQNVIINSISRGFRPEIQDLVRGNMQFPE